MNSLEHESEIAKLSFENAELKERVRSLELSLENSSSSVLESLHVAQRKQAGLKSLSIAIFVPLLVGAGRALYRLAYGKKY